MPPARRAGHRRARWRRRPALAASGARRLPAVRSGSRSVRHGATRPRGPRRRRAPRARRSIRRCPLVRCRTRNDVRAGAPARRGCRARPAARVPVIGTRRTELPLRRRAPGRRAALRRRRAAPRSLTPAAGGRRIVRGLRQVVGNQAVCARPACMSPRRAQAQDDAQPRSSLGERGDRLVGGRSRALEGVLVPAVVRSRVRSRRTRQSTSSPATEEASAASAISRSAGRPGAAAAPCSAAR